jgi:membrane protein
MFPPIPDDEGFAVKLNGNPAWSLVTKTVSSWAGDFAPSMGAALAFYTVFSIAPLLLIVTAVAGYFFGVSAARGEIVSQLTGLMGKAGAQTVEGLIASANDPSQRSLAAAIGIVVFLVGATSVFNELQDSLNRIWKAPRSPRTAGVFTLVRTRLLSFGMILAIAFLLMVSLLVSAALSALGKWWEPLFAGWQSVAQVLSFVLSFALITVLFALIFKIMPQTGVRWRDVWIGAAITSMLFTIGKQLVGIYLGRSSVVSAFGAVGSLAVVLLWVYYSAQIFLLGAEFTWVYSSSRAARNSPTNVDSIATEGRGPPIAEHSAR